MPNIAENIKDVFLDQMDHGSAADGEQTECVLFKLRKHARTSFNQSEFPTRKNEDWKYTSVRDILNQEYSTQPSPAFTAHIPKYFDAYTLRFVNGALDSADTNGLPEGVYVGRLSEVPEASNAHTELTRIADQVLASDMEVFESLSLGASVDPICVVIPDGVQLEKAIHFIYASEANNGAISSHPFTLISTGKHSNTQIVETFVGQNDASTYYTNTANRIFVGANAKFTHYRLQNEGDEGLHTARTIVYQERDSTYGIYLAELGGKLVRNNIHIVHQGENITSNIYGAMIGHRKQHIDLHSFVDHAMPHCLSNELIKVVLHDQSRGVFNGKIIVRPDAQKINAYQQNAALVLSKDAVMDSKPQLEIFADDVKCSHGATIGQLDHEALFFLKSRGLNDAEAKSLLKKAFVIDVINNFPNEQIATYIESQLDIKLTDTSSKNEN